MKVHAQSSGGGGLSSYSQTWAFSSQKLVNISRTSWEVSSMISCLHHFNQESCFEQASLVGSVQSLSQTGICTNHALQCAYSRSGRCHLHLWYPMPVGWRHGGSDAYPPEEMRGHGWTEMEAPRHDAYPALTCVPIPHSYSSWNKTLMAPYLIKSNLCINHSDIWPVVLFSVFQHISHVADFWNSIYSFLREVSILYSYK